MWYAIWIIGLTTVCLVTIWSAVSHEKRKTPDPKGEGEL